MGYEALEEVTDEADESSAAPAAHQEGGGKSFSKSDGEEQAQASSSRIGLGAAEGGNKLYSPYSQRLSKHKPDE